MHDLNLPSSINLAFTFTFSDHLRDILYKSESASRLPSPPIARDIPFRLRASKSRSGQSRHRTSTRRRQTRRGRFPGRQRRRGQVLGSASCWFPRPRRLQPAQPRRRRICNAGKCVFAPRRGRVWRERDKTHSSPVRVDREAVLWASGGLDDPPLIQIFYES